MKKYFIYILVMSFAITSCNVDDLLESGPTASLPPSEAFKDINALNQTVLGMYSGMQTNDYYSYFMMAAPSVMGDNFQTREAGKRSEGLYRYNQTQEATNGAGAFFNSAYYVISISNAILENIDNVPANNSADVTKKENYHGEALAVRAMAHFDLARVFGKLYTVDNTGDAVPLILTQQTPEDRPSRVSVKEVYDQVVKDLKTAIPLLGTDKTNGRINVWAAKSLLARVYLYMNMNTEALTLAQDVINNSPYSLVSNANYVASFQTDFNSETIFEIVNTSDDNPAFREGIAYVAGPSGTTGGYGAIITTQAFEDLISSDPNDVRNGFFKPDDSGNAKGYYAKYPGKPGQGVGLSNIKVIRLSEVYLIAAEAAVKSPGGNAKIYLEAIAKRANPAVVTPATPTLDDVLLERRKELALEGHRLWDALRNGKVLTRSGGRHLLGVLATVDNSTLKAVLPIPEAERRKNANLTQNPGY